MSTLSHLRFTVITAALTVACVASLSAAHADERDADFDLVCYGVGEKLESHTEYDWDRKHHEYKDRTALGTAQVSGGAQVEIHDGAGRIHLPKSLLPPLTTGSSGGGWFPIHDLVVTADRIQGSIKLNGLNKPGLSIDRRSGRLKLDGMESFEGSCNRFNPGSQKF